MNEYDKTDFLTPKSSFLVGMGSCLNIGGGYFDYNSSRTPSQADANALFMDWKIAGNDLRNVMAARPITSLHDNSIECLQH